MKTTLTNYTLNIATKQITMSDLTTGNEDRLYGIFNKTRAAWIYKALDTINYGGSFSGNVFTFNVDTTGWNNSDKLFISYFTDVSLDTQQVILSSSPTAAALGIKATMTAYGYQRMTLEPRLQFLDSFDGSTIDTTNNWIVSGTVIQSNSSVAIGNVLTTSTVNSLTSKNSFAPLGLSFQVLAFVAAFESSPLNTTNVNRFYGFGTHSSTPTISQPITDGVGFEWDSITDKLWLAVYQSGTRSASSVDISQYVTSNSTRYALLYRSDLVIAYIGSTEIPVASISFVIPSTQTLPIKLQTVISGTTPSTTPLNTIQAVTVGDTGGNSTQLSDGTYPTRKLKIDSLGDAYTLNNALDQNNNPQPLRVDSSSNLRVTDDSIALLSRILKTLESISIVDSAQRQRITIDSISAGLTLANVTAITNALPTGANTIGAVSINSGTNNIGGITQVAGMDREMYINIARTAYATGIRTKLN